jgi:hypothetical protein
MGRGRALRSTTGYQYALLRIWSVVLIPRNIAPSVQERTLLFLILSIRPIKLHIHQPGAISRAVLHGHNACIQHQRLFSVLHCHRTVLADIDRHGATSYNIFHVDVNVLAFLYVLFDLHVQLFTLLPSDSLSTPALMDVTEAMQTRFASSRSSEQMLTANALASVCCIQYAHWRAVCHHNVDSGKVWYRVLSNWHSVWRALVRGIISVLIAPVGKRPVAEFRLVWRRVYLQRSVDIRAKCLLDLRVISRRSST